MTGADASYVRTLLMSSVALSAVMAARDTTPHPAQTHTHTLGVTSWAGTSIHLQHRALLAVQAQLCAEWQCSAMLPVRH